MKHIFICEMGKSQFNKQLEIELSKIKQENFISISHGFSHSECGAAYYSAIIIYKEDNIVL